MLKGEWPSLPAPGDPNYQHPFSSGSLHLIGHQSAIIVGRVKLLYHNIPLA